MSSVQGAVSFQEVAVRFSEEEWRHLQDWQRELYKEVMQDNLDSLLMLTLIMMEEMGEASGTREEVSRGAPWKVEEWNMWDSLDLEVQRQRYKGPLGILDKLYHRCSHCQEVLGTWALLVDHKIGHWKCDPKLRSSIPHMQQTHCDQQRFSNGFWSSPNPPRGPGPGQANNPAQEDTKDLGILIVKCEDWDGSVRAEGQTGNPGRNFRNPLECFSCSKTFPSVSLLIEHKKWHKENQSFTCPDCGRSFVRKSVLKLHRRTHTGERPFACSECGKSFSQRFNLVIHQRIHSGEKPYKCQSCDKSYRYKPALVRHEGKCARAAHRTHAGGKAKALPPPQKTSVQKPASYPQSPPPSSSPILGMKTSSSSQPSTSPVASHHQLASDHASPSCPTTTRAGNRHSSSANNSTKEPAAPSDGHYVRKSSTSSITRMPEVPSLSPSYVYPPPTTKQLPSAPTTCHLGPSCSTLVHRQQNVKPISAAPIPSPSHPPPGMKAPSMVPSTPSRKPQLASLNLPFGVTPPSRPVTRNQLRDGGARNQLRDGGARNQLRDGGARNQLRDDGTKNQPIDGGTRNQPIDGGPSCSSLSQGVTSPEVPHPFYTRYTSPVYRKIKPHSSSSKSTNISSSPSTIVLSDRQASCMVSSSSSCSPACNPASELYGTAKYSSAYVGPRSQSFPSVMHPPSLQSMHSTKTQPSANIPPYSTSLGGPKPPPVMSSPSCAPPGTQSPLSSCSYEQRLCSRLPTPTLANLSSPPTLSSKQAPSASQAPRAPEFGPPTQLCGKWFQCGQCKRTFLHPSQLSEHQKTHTGAQHACPECNRMFHRKSTLILHRRTHTGEKPYACIECGRSFSQRFNLVIHQRIHTGERPYVCNDCNKGFRYRTGLLIHQRHGFCARRRTDQNAPSKPPLSPQKTPPGLSNGMAASSSGLGKDQAPRRTSEDKFPMSPPTSALKSGGKVATATPEPSAPLYMIRGKLITKRKENAVCHTSPRPPVTSIHRTTGPRDQDPPFVPPSHPPTKAPPLKSEPNPQPASTPKRTSRRGHPDKNKFKCDHCKRCFSRAERFAEHQILHATARYVCPECGRAFSKPSQLLLHQRTHTGEKPYCCPKCGRQFSQKFNLIVHQRIHTGEKPFKCPNCGKEFRYRAGLLRHQKYRQCS